MLGLDLNSAEGRIVPVERVDVAEYGDVVPPLPVSALAAPMPAKRIPQVATATAASFWTFLICSPPLLCPRSGRHLKNSAQKGSERNVIHALITPTAVQITKLLDEPSGQEASLPVAPGVTLLKAVRCAPVCS